MDVNSSAWKDTKKSINLMSEEAKNISERVDLLRTNRIFSFKYKKMWNERLSLAKQLYLISDTDPRRSEIERKLNNLKSEMEEMKIQGKDRI